jgi:nuclear cap-binding protein subunit 2
MAQVVACLDQPSTYRDSRSEVREVFAQCLAGFAHPSFQLDRESERRLLAQSSTLYVGNLSFYTTEAQMYECKL